MNLQKIDHGNVNIYEATNLNPLPHQGTDHHAVPLYQDVPTHHGGSTLYCPVTSRAITTLNPSAGTVGPLQGVSIWEVSGAFDANITIPTFLFGYHTMIISASITAGRTWTTPSAVNLINLVTHPQYAISSEALLGTTTWEFVIGTTTVNNITLAAGAGCIFKGYTPTVVISPYRRFFVRLTDLRPGNEAYELWTY